MYVYFNKLVKSQLVIISWKLSILTLDFRRSSSYRIRYYKKYHILILISLATGFPSHGMYLVCVLQCFVDGLVVASPRKRKSRRNEGADGAKLVEA